MKAYRKLILVIAAVVISLTFLTLHVFGPPVPLSKMEMVKEGMSEADVKNILGNPTTVYAGQWTYTRIFTFGYVNVLFDQNKKVQYAHYETF